MASRASALTIAPSLAAADTFINSAFPDNNNGQSASIYTGRNGQGGSMRALVRFDLPAGIQGRATVSGVALTMTTRGLGNSGTNAPTPATESLQSLTTTWTEGNGVGDASTMFTVGDLCDATGATWNQPDCTGGTSWAGGAVAATISGQASVPAAVETAVVWSSATAGNEGMVSDVQGWLDDPTTNRGWRIISSTDGDSGSAAQRFYAAEGDASRGPTLEVTYDCRPGFAQQGSDCAIAPGDAGDGPVADGGDAADGGADGSAGGSGCSCSVSRTGTSAGALFASLAIGLLAAARRRRLTSRGAPSAR
jgi:MYXO-CTERM domain-containing protein